jgi:8-oxo-dGTP pyrophosphatase MutT (NUDIX family)
VYPIPEITRRLIAEINSTLTQQAIYGFSASAPLLHIVGKKHLPAEWQHEEPFFIRQLEEKNRPNDPHVVVDVQITWPEGGLNASTLLFSEICVLRAHKTHPHVLAGVGVVMCPERRVLLLNQRGKDVATYPGALHTLGGTFVPPGFKTHADEHGIIDTVARELHEESGLSLSVLQDALQHAPRPVMWGQEVSTGGCQITYLGIPIKENDWVNPAQASQAPEWEGHSLEVGFDELPEVLMRPDWVPSGLAHILAWLAWDAPNTKPLERFGHLSAQDLVIKILNK